MRAEDQEVHPLALERQRANEAEELLAAEKARLEIWKGRAQLGGRSIVTIYVMIQMGRAEDFGERVTWVLVVFALLGIVAAEKLVDRFMGRVGGNGS